MTLPRAFIQGGRRAAPLAAHSCEPQASWPAPPCGKSRLTTPPLSAAKEASVGAGTIEELVEYCPQQCIVYMDRRCGIAEKTMIRIGIGRRLDPAKVQTIG